VSVTQHQCTAALHRAKCISQCSVLLCNSSAAMPWCWVTADLYEQQTFKGVKTETQSCCQAVLQSSTE